MLDFCYISHLPNNTNNNALQISRLQDNNGSAETFFFLLLYLNLFCKLIC